MPRSHNPKAGTADYDGGDGEETSLAQHQPGVVVEGGDDVGKMMECFAGRELSVMTTKKQTDFSDQII